VPILASTRVLLNGVTTTTTGSTFDLGSNSGDRTFIAYVAGTGAVSATVLIEVSNNGTHFGTLATFSLSGTTSAGEPLVTDDAWQYVRARVTAISGTGAAVTVTMVA
jgi:hypothetical protein